MADSLFISVNNYDKMNHMTKNTKKGAMWAMGIVAVIILGGGLGFGIFYATKEASKDVPLKVETTPGSGRLTDGSDLPGELAEEYSPIRSDEERQDETYEGSQAEIDVVREVSEEEKKTLEDSVSKDGYVNKAYGFAFEPPEGWYADGINSDIGQFISYTSFDPENIDTRPEDAGLIFEAIVQGNTKNQTLDEWVEEGHSYMKVISSEKITIGEHEAYKEELDYQGKMSVLTIVKGEDVFSFSLMGKDYEDNKDVFEDIVNSLTVL